MVQAWKSVQKEAVFRHPGVVAELRAEKEIVLLTWLRQGAMGHNGDDIRAVRRA
jgi:hypothetical protein